MEVLLLPKILVSRTDFTTNASSIATSDSARSEKDSRLASGYEGPARISDNINMATRIFTEL